MASKENEAVNESESEGDSLSSLIVITKKSIRGPSQRTYSTSEVDREEKTSAKIVTEFLSCSPAVNIAVHSVRHAPLLSHGTGAKDMDILVEQTAGVNLDTVCKKKQLSERPATYYSPPVQHRPTDLPSQPLRPRSRSVPDYSDMQRSMECLTDEQEDVAKMVGGRLHDIACRMHPKLSYERVLCETLALATSQTGCQVVPVKIFRHTLEIVRGQSSGWTYGSIMDMLFYGRKLFSQFLINFEGDDFEGLRLMDQFVEFFNVHCLPWIRSHGGWGKVLYHGGREMEDEMSSTVDTSHEGNWSQHSSGYESMEQPPLDGLDERDNAVFFDSDEDSSILEPPASQLPLSHSTPARQLSDIPEIESPNVSSQLPPNEASSDSQDAIPSSTATNTSNNLLFCGTIAMTIYNKLNH